MDTVSIFPLPTPDNGPCWTALRIGILGGSFSPPHEGHLHAALTALRMLRLDAVWWLVSPQNPLKSAPDLPLTERVSLCRTLCRTHPRLLVTALEEQLGTMLTWRTIRALRTRFPHTAFVWVTGMDNALTMHRWHNWTDILGHVATAHIARPPASGLVAACPLRLRTQQTHIMLDRPISMPLRPLHTFWLLQGRMLDLSSTTLRAAQAQACA